MSKRRWIDPMTGDYVVENGAPRGDNTRVSKVVFRLRKKRGTGIYPHIGSRLHLIRKNTTGSLRLARAYAFEAIDDLVKAGEIRDLEIETKAVLEKGTTVLAVDCSFTDTDGDQRSVRFTKTFGG